jgi:hypothetical protein
MRQVAAGRASVALDQHILANRRFASIEELEDAQKAGAATTADAIGSAGIQTPLANRRSVISTRLQGYRASSARRTRGRGRKQIPTSSTT